MSDFDMIRELRANDARLRLTEVKEIPALYLPWTQRILNPFPLASSGSTWGDQVQPWPVNVLAFYCSVFVSGTNNGTNFWTISLLNEAGVALASFNTSAIAASTWTRFAVTGGSITQPATTNSVFPLSAIATLSPGSIYIAPAVALLRTGN